MQADLNRGLRGWDTDGMQASILVWFRSDPRNPRSKKTPKISKQIARYVHLGPHTRGMEDKYLNELAAFRKRKTFLETPENKLIWNGLGPLRFTALTGEVYPLIDALGALAANQEVGPSPGYAQQNTDEENLEADAIIMSAAISEYYRDAGMVADSQQWDIPDTGWTRAREQKLLNQAKLLRKNSCPSPWAPPPPAIPTVSRPRASRSTPTSWINSK